MFLEPKEQDALVSWDVYLAWRKSQEAELDETDVRRQLREEPIRRIKGRENEQWLEVSSPVSMDLVLDGVHMKTRVAVVLQGQLKEGVVLGKEQLRCWNIKEFAQAIGTVDLDSNAGVEVEFPIQGEESVMLRGLIDTGAGLSLMSLQAWRCISTPERYPIRNLPIQLVAANGLGIRTYGIVENVELILAGYNLRANFILMDAVDNQDFILGRTFLKKYDVLVDLRKWKLTIRDPYMQSSLAEPILQVSTEPPVDVLVTEHVMMKTCETTLIPLKLRSEKSLKNRLMLITQKDGVYNGRVFLGDSVVRSWRRDFLLVFNDESRLSSEDTV